MKINPEKSQINIGFIQFWGTSYGYTISREAAESLALWIEGIADDHFDRGYLKARVLALTSEIALKNDPQDLLNKAIPRNPYSR